MMTVNSTDRDMEDLAERLAPARVAVRQPDGSVTVAELAVHPMALLIPGMSDADEQRLRADIAVNGVLDPLVMFEGRVLDGRHRLRIASTAGAVVRLTEFTGSGVEARAFVWSANVSRRHLNQAQLALAAERFGFTERARAGDGSWPQASRAIGGTVSPRSLQRFSQGRVISAPQTAARIDAGDVSRIDRAVKLAAAELGTAVPPTVHRSAWDRLGCARGDVLAVRAAVQAGEEIDRVRFAERAREIQAALVAVDQLLYARAGNRVR